MRRIYRYSLPSWYSGFMSVSFVVALVFLIFGILFVGGLIYTERENDFYSRCFSAGLTGAKLNVSDSYCVAHYDNGFHTRNLMHSKNADTRVASLSALIVTNSEQDFLAHSLRELAKTKNLEITEVLALCVLKENNIQQLCNNPQISGFLTATPNSELLRDFDMPDNEEVSYPRSVLWIGLGIYCIFGLVFVFSYFPLNIKQYYSIPDDTDSWIFTLSFLPFWLGGMAVIASVHLPFLVFIGGYRRISARRATRHKRREEEKKYGEDVVKYLRELEILEQEVKKEKDANLRNSLLRTIGVARKDAEDVKAKRVGRLSEVKEEVKDKSNLFERVQAARDKAASMLDAENI